MDSKKAGQLLERINALHRSLHALGEKVDISSIERDLMLSYLRQVYEIYQDADVGSAASTNSRPSPARSAPVAPAPPPPKPVVVAAPTPPPPAPTPTPQAPAAPPHVEAKPADAAPPAPAPKKMPSTPPPPVKKASPKIEKLFLLPEAKELSDRLGLQPIKDLTRALTINNRVQYANVLFGGNSDLMNSVLQRLNAFKSSAEAKPDLVELAEQFEWTEDEKADVARDFIKLVSRRYV